MHERLGLAWALRTSLCLYPSCKSIFKDAVKRQLHQMLEADADLSGVVLDATVPGIGSLRFCASVKM